MSALKKEFGGEIVFQTIRPKTQERLLAWCMHPTTAAVHILDKERLPLVPYEQLLREQIFVTVEYPGPNVVQLRKVKFETTSIVRKRFPIAA